jgi:hypothetical protein
MDVVLYCGFKLGRPHCLSRRLEKSKYEYDPSNSHKMEGKGNTQKLFEKMH